MGPSANKLASFFLMEAFRGPWGHAGCVGEVAGGRRGDPGLFVLRVEDRLQRVLVSTASSFL